MLPHWRCFLVGCRALLCRPPGRGREQDDLPEAHGHGRRQKGGPQVRTKIEALQTPEPPVPGPAYI